MAVALVLVAGCGEDSALPHIDQVAPIAAARGARVDVLGTRFCGAEAPGGGECPGTLDGFVSFGAEGVTRALARAWSDERIVVDVPATAATGASTVVVTVAGRPSNAVSFEVQP